MTNSKQWTRYGGRKSSTSIGRVEDYCCGDQFTISATFCFQKVANSIACSIWMNAEILPRIRTSQAFGRSFRLRFLKNVDLTVLHSSSRVSVRDEHSESVHSIWALPFFHSRHTNYPTFVSGRGRSNCRMTFLCGHARNASAECSLTRPERQFPSEPSLQLASAASVSKCPTARPTSRANLSPLSGKEGHKGGLS